MIIELIDGPLKGVIHEMDCRFPMPDGLAILDEDNPRIRYCYVVDKMLATAKFSHQERNKAATEPD